MTTSTHTTISAKGASGQRPKNDVAAASRKDCARSAGPRPWREVFSASSAGRRYLGGTKKGPQQKGTEYSGPLLPALGTALSVRDISQTKSSIRVTTDRLRDVPLAKLRTLTSATIDSKKSGCARTVLRPSLARKRAFVGGARPDAGSGTTPMACVIEPLVGNGSVFCVRLFSMPTVALFVHAVERTDTNSSQLTTSIMTGQSTGVNSRRSTGMSWRYISGSRRTTTRKDSKSYALTVTLPKRISVSAPTRPKEDASVA